MRLFLLAIGFQLFFASGCPALAAAPSPTEDRPAETPGGLVTDDRTFSEIFDSNLKESETKVSEARSPLEVEFAYNTGAVKESSLENNYFSLNLAKQDIRLSTFRIYASYELWRFGNFALSPGAGLGYGFQENILDVDAPGRGTYRDAIRLKWAPIFVGAKLGYRLPWWKAGMLFLRGGARYEWFSVAGSLDGLSQTYWNLGYQLSFGINLLESDPQRLDSWFGGLFLATGIAGPFRASGGVKSSFYEAGVRFLL